MKKAHGKAARPMSHAKRWMALVLCALCIYLFMFVIAPRLGKNRWVRPLLTYVEETGIDASALFYTETEESGEAGLHLRESLRIKRKDR